MASKEFIDLMNQSIEIHKKKAEDYANPTNPFDNFDKQIQLMEWFTSDLDKCFAGIAAQKLARLANLSNGKTPNFESIEDTELDLITYIGLWMAKRRVGRPFDKLKNDIANAQNYDWGRTFSQTKKEELARYKDQNKDFIYDDNGNTIGKIVCSVCMQPTVLKVIQHAIDCHGVIISDMGVLKYPHGDTFILTPEQLNEFKQSLF